LKRAFLGDGESDETASSSKFQSVTQKSARLLAPHITLSVQAITKVLIRVAAHACDKHDEEEGKTHIRASASRSLW
jgi:hypothetical protein